MKKSKPGVDGIHDPLHLFRGVALKRHRRLVLPKFLEEEAARPILRGVDFDNAHAILTRWADLESNGHLAGNETSLDEPFRQEVFGQALRFTTGPKSPTAFYYEKKLHIPNVGYPDGVLGHFPPVQMDKVRAAIELKDASTDLDHDKFNGRTPVQQCWDYINNLPSCDWGIVSNFVSFRLYHKNKTQQAFEHFELQKLRDPEEFARFYCLFERDGLLASRFVKVPRTLALMQKSDNRQKQVGDDLYDYYSDQRIQLIQHLVQKHNKTQDQALRAAQKLLDRIIFVAFCEDRGLLPHRLIKSTWTNVAPLARVTNPRWKNFLDMFYAIDKGHTSLDLATGYNGGLFRKDDNVDDLDLEDRWTDIFNRIGDYDFAEDINVDVLGHIFEKSVSEIEKLRTGGAFFIQTPQAAPTMPKSAERKRFGIYYTPPDFTRFIVERTVGAVIEERFAALAAEHQLDPQASMRTEPAPKFAAYWEQCLASLRQIAIVDPACGSGAFLIAAYELLEEHYQTVIENIARHEREPTSKWLPSVPENILTENLHGVDLSKEAVEITQTALWIRSARKGRRLDDLSGNIVVGNSLVTDKAVHPDAMKWPEKFPRIFQRPGGAGFDCVVGNPPWERMKLQEREFFAFSAPDIASAVNAADRRKKIAELEKQNPTLFAEYEKAKAAAERTLNHVRTAGEFPFTARGDINTYMLFAELARKIVRPTGRVGLLVPSGIATDATTKDFFAELVSSKTLTATYDFVNRLGLFPDVEGRMKFCVLLVNGRDIKPQVMDFVFWAERMLELSQKNRHIKLTANDLKLMNPNTLTCPIFRNNRDAELTREIYRRVPILVDKARQSGGNPWGIRFLRMFDQTNDAEHFATPDKMEADGLRLAGNRWTKGKREFLPLFEAKMTRDYDHRASKVVMNAKNWYMNYSAESASLVEHQNPEFLPAGRWSVDAKEVETRSPPSLKTAAIAFHDIARANDTRTMVACMLPFAAASNTVPLIVNDGGISWRRFCRLLGNLNSVPYDFVVRQKAGGAHLNFFIVEQIPTFPPDTYDEKCPWDKKQILEKWISDRVLKLTCTANDMLPLAEAAGFKEGVHKWKEPERAELRAELDAAYFHLYGISRDDAAYILSTFQGMTDGDAETFTPSSPASRILEIYDALAEPG